MVKQNHLKAVRKLFSNDLSNSPKTRVFASATILACQYLLAASGSPQLKKKQPRTPSTASLTASVRQCPPVTDTDCIAATAPGSCLDSGGTEHVPLWLDVLCLSWVVFKVLSEVRVKAPSDKRLCRTFSADPYNTSGPASCVQPHLSRSKRHGSCEGSSPPEEQGSPWKYIPANTTSKDCKKGWWVICSAVWLIGPKNSQDPSS